MLSKELKEKNFISAVVYVRNNEDEITEFLTTVNDWLKDNFLTYEIICVNDHSTDNSAEKIKSFAKTTQGEIITLLNMSYYQGLESSMHAGVDLSIGDFIYEFETVTISYPVQMLRDVYDNCLSGYDIVSAYPKSSGHKQSKIFYLIYNSLSGTSYKFRTEAFRILSRRAINRVQSMSETLPYRKAAYANCGLKTNAMRYNNIKGIPHTSDKERQSQKETAENALILYTDAAYKFSMTFAKLIALCTILIAAYTCYIYFTGKPVRGWTTTMLFLSFGFFAMTSILTFIVKYSSLILKIVFRKTKYTIESIEKLK